MKTFATMALMGIATALSSQAYGQSSIDAATASSSDTLDQTMACGDGLVEDAGSLEEGSGPTQEDSETGSADTDASGGTET